MIPWRSAIMGGPVSMAPMSISSLPIPPAWCARLPDRSAARRSRSLEYRSGETPRCRRPLRDSASIAHLRARDDAVSDPMVTMPPTRHAARTPQPATTHGSRPPDFRDTARHRPLPPLRAHCRIRLDRSRARCSACSAGPAPAPASDRIRSATFEAAFRSAFEQHHREFVAAVAAGNVAFAQTAAGACADPPAHFIARRQPARQSAIHNGFGRARLARIVAGCASGNTC